MGAAFAAWTPALARAIELPERAGSMTAAGLTSAPHLCEPQPTQVSTADEEENSPDPNSVCGLADGLLSPVAAARPVLEFNYDRCGTMGCILRDRHPGLHVIPQAEAALCQASSGRLRKRCAPVAPGAGSAVVAKKAAVAATRKPPAAPVAKSARSRAGGSKSAARAGKPAARARC